MHTENSPKILAIETSCDDTAAAVVTIVDGMPVILSSVVSSQIELHRQYGGVVPALAAREHVKNLVPVINEALQEAGVVKDDIHAIAVTQGPGLIPALLAGVSAAKALALAWQKPLLGIHHIEGHIYANFIDKLTTDNSSATSPQSGVSGPARADEQATDNTQLTIEEHKSLPRSTGYSLSERERKNVETENPGSSSTAGGEVPLGRRSGSNPFPLLALVVSGGHTELVLMQNHFTYEILGRTKDDAAGEAFDKVAKMLGLPYPGGPEVAARAAQVESRKSIKSKVDESTVSQLEIENGKLKIADEFRFPRPMIDSGDYNFSFSGLKTAVLYEIRKTSEADRDESFVNGICHAFQEAVVDVLVTKTKRAIEEYSPAMLVIAGGVSANISLRETLAMMIQEFPYTDFAVPEFKYSLDNAAMIGAAAILRYSNLSPDEREALKRNAIDLEPDAHLQLES